MNIFEKLGFTDIEFGNIQSVDEMTILPILGEKRTNNVAEPESLKFAGNSSYGQMRWSNSDPEREAIVPNNTIVISDKAAQDHGMSETGIIPANKTIEYNNACCVQSSQGGMLDKNDEKNAFDILPLELRKYLIDPNIRFKHGYDKLWNSIERFLKDIPGVSGRGGHLEYFFRPFKKELDDFAAEFEPVENQLGAIIFFLNQPVGIEIMPSTNHWISHWQWLIRGCYGAQLLKMKKSGQFVNYKLDMPSIEGEITIDKLLTATNQFIINSKLSFLAKINELANKEFTIVKGKDNKRLLQKEFIYTNTNSGGDIIKDGDKSVYASLVI